MSDFKLPDLGENIESGDVVSVLVSEGDVVKAQQDVIEIETDKAVIAVPSDVGGQGHENSRRPWSGGEAGASDSVAAAGGGGIGGTGQSVADAGKRNRPPLR